MLKKRLVGVITVKNGWAVQSFGFSRYLPLGKPECIAQNLDRWGADEILLQVIDRSRTGSGPDFGLLEKVARLGISTPLIYSGGIRSAADGIAVIQSGADRLVVDSLLRNNPHGVAEISNRLGAQAVIASLPLTWNPAADALELFDYTTRRSRPIPQTITQALESKIISEAFVQDWAGDGTPNGFDVRLVEQFPVPRVPLIAFGGLSEPEQLNRLLQHPQAAAVAIGNFLNYREHSVQRYREQLRCSALRPSEYDSRRSI